MKVVVSTEYFKMLGKAKYLYFTHKKMNLYRHFHSQNGQMNENKMRSSYLTLLSKFKYTKETSVNNLKHTDR